MGNRSLAYSINGIRYGEAWNTLPGELYPAISLKKPAKVRIEIHKKPIIIDNNSYLMSRSNVRTNIPNIPNISTTPNPSNPPNNSYDSNISNTLTKNTSKSTSQVSVE